MPASRDARTPAVHGLYTVGLHQLLIRGSLLVLGLERVQLAHQGHDSIPGHSGKGQRGPGAGAGDEATHLSALAAFALRTSSPFALAFAVHSSLADMAAGASSLLVLDSTLRRLRAWRRKRRRVVRRADEADESIAPCM